MLKSSDKIGPKGKIPLQSRFPWLWLAAQYLIAGYFDRRRHIRKHYCGQKAVLEVGCSVGIDSGVFSHAKRYLGIDIDEKAVKMARARFAGNLTMSFEAADIRHLNPETIQFDYILFCGTLHHIPDTDARAVLDHAAKLLTDGGIIVVIDYAPHANPGWLERLILKLEDGHYVRDCNALLDLLHSVKRCEIADLTIFKNAAFLLPWPVMARKFLIKMRPRP